MELPSATASARSQLIEAAVKQWTKNLVDIGKRNPLLYYRDMKLGTLSLEAASGFAMESLLAGKTVSSSTLFIDRAIHDDASKRLRTIRKKVVELQEERGIQTGFLALGLATWWDIEGESGGRTPAAPVFLREVTIKPRSTAEDEFDIHLGDDTEINPVLLHFLAEEHGTVIDADAFASDLDLGDEYAYDKAIERLVENCSSVKGFRIDAKALISTFAYQKLPMVKDLQADLELLSESDVIAALAGDTEAQSALREGNATGTEPEPEQPDATVPSDEFLVLDADSSQNYAINAVLAGQNVVIKGPPGTGKSQTISNLIASLIARGDKVLFVAEKRAAIDAVLHRLEHVDLGTWVMDLHEGVSSRRRVAQQLADTLDRASTTPQPELASLHRNLTVNRDRLINHQSMMHTLRRPWNISAFEAQNRRLGHGEISVNFRWQGTELSRMTPDLLAQAQDALAEFADLGGLDSEDSSLWSSAPIETEDAAREALRILQQLRQNTLPAATRTLHNVLEQTGLPAPATVLMWRNALEFIQSASHVLSFFKAEILAEELGPFIVATATGRWRSENQVEMKWGERRRLAKLANEFCTTGTAKKSLLHGKLIAADELIQKWKAVSVDGLGPRLPQDLPSALKSFEKLTQELEDLGAYLSPMQADFESFDLNSTLSQRLTALAAEQRTVTALPRRHQLSEFLDQSCGLDPLLAELRANVFDSNDAGKVLEAVWLESILDEIALQDFHYGAFDGTSLDRAVEAFQSADTEHIQTTASRVQRRSAENLYAALDQYPEQATLLRKEANRKRGHLAMRELLARAPEVMMALKPCWAMSPLVVSQVLPLRQMFDVVIFDEASQIPPADAIPAIARGQRVVVAGDERQLPPTSFFASTNIDEGEEDANDYLTLTRGFESILDALAPVAPTRGLEWHYRSRDERLIAFSNAHIYDSMLTTFPGALESGVLKHVLVPWTPGFPGNENSSYDEVMKVADLVIEHAENRPEESLGVIAMGINHANRIEAEVRNRVKERRDLDRFFSENLDERFFVKNLERVQGDERDAIILSIGYGKGANGRMLYRFGPLNQEGGERRLNVAVSRAKSRMTLVSSFSSGDLEPSKLRSRGAQLLGAYIEFMESGGADLGSFSAVPPRLNAFEQDIRDRLTATGLKLTAQYGVSGYKIDFVASHPQQPGRFILAIEADGATYHSSATARDRDRLRQNHLENLGWRFHRIWSTDWFRNPEAEVEKTLAAYSQALAASDKGEPAGRRSASVSDESKKIPSIQNNRIGECPVRATGIPITEYRQRTLIELINWIESDGLLRTEDDLIDEAKNALGFRKRGTRIVRILSAAITAARG